MKLLTTLFTYNKETRCFATDASDIQTDDGLMFSSLPTDNRCFGITLVSEKTGISVDYYLFDTINYDNIDNEILYWHLIPTGQSKQDVPECNNTCIRVFND